MIEEIILLYILPAVLFFMAYRSKKKLYVHIGIFTGILLLMYTLIDTEVFEMFTKAHLNAIPPEILLKYIIVGTLLASIPFLIYVYVKEAEARKRGESTYISDDFRKVLLPAKGNIIFWILIIIYYIVCKKLAG